jgi:hypothetical protein
MSEAFNQIIHSCLSYSITQILDAISLVFNFEHNNKNHLYKQYKYNEFAVLKTKICMYIVLNPITVESLFNNDRIIFKQ